MAVDLATQAARAKSYPNNFNDRERKLLESVKTYVDAQVGGKDTLAEMDDTDISSPSTAEVLVYDGTDSWDNVAVSGDIGLAADGTTSITADSIVDADVNSAAAISTSKLALSTAGLEFGAGTPTSVLNLDSLTSATNLFETADGVAASVSADGMTADPETDTEAGYVTIDIDGTSYQIPIYAA